MKNISEGKIAIMVGSLSDGYEIIGPFDNFDAANDWLDSDIGVDFVDWRNIWLMSMTGPCCEVCQNSMPMFGENICTMCEDNRLRDEEEPNG